MRVVLKKELTIDRPIVFLCGPYYNGNNLHDRRALLRNYFRKDLGGKSLPLIIDDFLSEENLKGFNLELPLLEEILARISRKTLIFLDTISAASEMGLFLNHAFKNKNVVFLPTESDIVQKQVGVFAQNVIKHNDNAHCMYYRPSITLSTVATGYTSEFYGFINDRIPSNIAEYLQKDSELVGYNEKWAFEKIKLSDREAYKIKLPIRQLFYIVVSIVYEKYFKTLRTPGPCDDSLFVNDEIFTSVKEAIYNYYEEYTNEPMPFKFLIETDFSESIEKIIYHMVSFVFIYHKRSSSGGYQIIAEHDNRSVSFITGKYPHHVFGLNKNEFDVLIKSQQHPEDFFAKEKLVINGKKRELVKYTDNKYGLQIRSIHKKILKRLNALYKQHNLSFAYKKKNSIKSCAMMHIKGYDFIKFDISKFFNSIDQKILLKLFIQEFQIDEEYQALTRKYLESFFVFGKLPLGLVLSPLLSDVYMKDFDKTMEMHCQSNAWLYTRYADDILISSRHLISDSEYVALESTVNNLLAAKKLKLNEEKKLHIALDRRGKYVKYIGISIVKGSKGNYLSVGKKYIYQVSKEIHEYTNYRKELRQYESMNSENNLKYLKQIIYGKLGFIRYIEGDRGIHQIEIRLKNYLNTEPYYWLKQLIQYWRYNDKTCAKMSE